MKVRPLVPNARNEGTRCLRVPMARSVRAGSNYASSTTTPTVHVEANLGQRPWQPKPLFWCAAGDAIFYRLVDRSGRPRDEGAEFLLFGRDEDKSGDHIPRRGYRRVAYSKAPANLPRLCEW
eukprot:4396029-Amphidinium_carterae.1